MNSGVSNKIEIFALMSIILSVATDPVLKNSNLFPLSIIHINDFHARYEATNTNGGQCENVATCIGGYARTVYTVRSLMESQKNHNPIYLNAGDNFQGTLWYNIGGWNVTSEFLNYLPADAVTLGNHEFDNGIDGVLPFLERLESPIVVANIDSSQEPTMLGKFNKSIIIERSGRLVGIIGVILQTTNTMASTGNLIFTNESQAVRQESLKLRNEGANIIIVLSHCGYDVDQTIATIAGDVIDVIVGAHTHTFLYTGDHFPGPEMAGGPYPTVIMHESKHKVLILQASAYARYVGNITVYFDDNGNIVDYEGAPLYMSSSVPEAEDIVEAMQPWKKQIDVTGNVIIGETQVDLTKFDCGYGECNLGDFVTDAFVHAFNDSNVLISIVNIGTLRVPLMKGSITYSHLVTMSPFENNLIAYNLPGEKLIEALEYSVKYINEREFMSYTFLQVSGLKIRYDYRMPIGQRVMSIEALCANISEPKYELIDPKKLYRIVSPDYIVDGGDGFTMISDFATNKTLGVKDLDALISYTNYTTPITLQKQERIIVTYINGTSSTGNETSSNSGGTTTTIFIRKSSNYLQIAFFAFFPLLLCKYTSILD